MDSNYTYTEKLINYLDGELPFADVEALQNELKTNTAMQQELDNLIMARAVIKNYGTTQKVKNIHQEMMEEMRTQLQPPKTAVRSLPKMFMRIAAGIILFTCLFGLYQYFSVSGGKLYDEQYMAYQQPIMRGNSKAGKIEQLYTEKKYDEVVTTYAQTTSPSINEQFLTGQAYLIKADYDNAIKTFSGILQGNTISGSGILNDDAEYYLALSYLKNNQTSKALPLLKKIHDDKNHLYHSKIGSWYLVKVKLLHWKN